GVGPRVEADVGAVAKVAFEVEVELPLEVEVGAGVGLEVELAVPLAAGCPPGPPACALARSSRRSASAASREPHRRFSAAVFASSVWARSVPATTSTRTAFSTAGQGAARSDSSALA